MDNTPRTIKICSNEVLSHTDYNLLKTISGWTEKCTQKKNGPHMSATLCHFSKSTSHRNYLKIH